MRSEQWLHVDDNKLSYKYGLRSDANLFAENHFGLEKISFVKDIFSTNITLEYAAEE